MEFYDNSDNSLIANVTGLSNGSFATTTWSSLNEDTTYNWYAKAIDNNTNSNTSSIFSFTANSLWLNLKDSEKSFRVNETIKINQDNFTLGGEPYTFIGMNTYYLVDYATNETYDDDGNHITNSRKYVKEVLNEMHYLNLNMLRTWGHMACGNNATGYSVWECNESGGHYNVFEVNDTGNYNEEMFKALDWLIAEAGKRDIRVNLVLVNTWNDYGGMRWYVQQSPTTNKTYENVTNTSSDNYWEFHDQFYDDDNCRQYFKDYIKHLVNRTNTITGENTRTTQRLLSGLWRTSRGQNLMQTGVNY